MHKVITGTVFAVAALATTAAFAEGTKATQSQPTAIERFWSDVTGSGSSTKSASKSSTLTSADRVRLNGYAPTGKPALDNWVRESRRFQTGGPNG